MDPLRAERVLTNSAQCPLHQGLNTRLLSAKCGRGGGGGVLKGKSLPNGQGPSPLLSFMRSNFIFRTTNSKSYRPRPPLIDTMERVAKAPFLIAGKVPF